MPAFLETTFEEYQRQNLRFVCVYDTPVFAQSHADRCDAVHYLHFPASDPALGIIAGVRGDALLIPFSAPHGGFSSFKKHPRIVDFLAGVEGLLEFGKSRNLKRCEVVLPPYLYDEETISKTATALGALGFRLKYCDLGFCLKLDASDYFAGLDIKARQKLASSLKQNLQFSKVDETDRKQAIYEAIRRSREKKGIPLRLEFERLLKIEQAVKVEWLLVTSQALPVAGAVVYLVADAIAQLIYWGNEPGSEPLRPMNFLACQMYEFYRGRNFKLVDIGHATDKGIPNVGLCDFKQSIGCVTSNKNTWEFDFVAARV